MIESGVIGGTRKRNIGPAHWRHRQSPNGTQYRSRLSASQWNWPSLRLPTQITARALNVALDDRPEE